MTRRALAVLLAVIGGTALAQSAGGDFAIKRGTVANGGGETLGGDFIVTGSAGQHDAGGAMLGGDFRVQGGFWPERAAPLGPAIFRNGFEGP